MPSSGRIVLLLNFLLLCDFYEDFREVRILMIILEYLLSRTMVFKNNFKKPFHSTICMALDFRFKIAVAIFIVLDYLLGDLNKNFVLT